MQAIIIYDDLAMAAKANAMLERASHCADQALIWGVKFWRVPLFQLPGAADLALADAEDAHLILIGLRHPRPFPISLANWLEHWAVRRWVQDAALALMNSGDGDLFPATAPPELSELAKRHGLSLIHSDARPIAEDSTTIARELPEGEQCVVSRL